MSAPESNLPPGEIQFFDAFESVLKDGAYRIEVSQTVSAAAASVAPVTQQFVVQGPRFHIDPGEVHTQFPPNGATSIFEEVLPHVVLNKRLLPWERQVKGLPGAVPWLALLVFQQGELLGDTGGGNGGQTLTVEQLLSTDTPGVVRKPLPQAGSVTAAELALQCQAITFPSKLFVELVPTARELPYLAHVRQVHTADKAHFNQKDDGWFSVVVANRFPQAGTASAAAKNIVHLVSLEGFGDLLGGNAPVAPAQPQIQMVSLLSWTFSCLADPAQTFGGLAQNLAYDSTGHLRPAASLILRLPFTPSNSSDPMTVLAQQRLTDGYVALGYHAPSGEDGFAWYRGPLSPTVPAVLRGAGDFATSDAATIYDSTTGVFDLSLATAFQVGRSLALSSAPFATALIRVRQKATAALYRRMASRTNSLHTQLAALFAGGAIETIRSGSTSGKVLALRRRASAQARSAPATALRALLAQPEVRTELNQPLTDDPDALGVADFLGQLLLLRNIPFVHLVPDARALPVESIRFFYLDANWLSALLDGALSVGLGTSLESAVQSALTRQLEEMAQSAALAWRGGQLGQLGQSPPPPPAGPTAGFLLRSALVSGWPGLGVSATLQDRPLPLLRMERLGPNVLLALFNGVPDTITFSEPQEGLEFGVNDFGKIEVRTIDPPKVTGGKAVHVYDPRNPAAVSVAIRTGGRRVLNISSDSHPPSGPPLQPADLLELLAQALEIAPLAIGPADFAVQMVKGPEELRFSLSPQPKPGV